MQGSYGLCEPPPGPVSEGPGVLELTAGNRHITAQANPERKEYIL